ncbi:hypothetical protein [Rhizobium sp. LCM 4573]|uniref:hypothetical protein n=1 Tax=Rhizobium sp. LCM 4573 TaxID=1848291 RepID=UPI0010424CEB|nr:hypothetical protein [Rhizobium sp. LCM 4573]
MIWIKGDMIGPQKAVACGWMVSVADRTLNHQEGARRKGFTTIRMYRGSAPPVNIHWIFGITKLELG